MKVKFTVEDLKNELSFPTIRYVTIKVSDDGTHIIVDVEPETDFLKLVLGTRTIYKQYPERASWTV
jgi:hypothetical protein